jgi:hypothetical protein
MDEEQARRGDDKQKGAATGELHGGIQGDGLDERRRKDQGCASSERETRRGASGFHQGAMEKEAGCRAQGRKPWREPATAEGGDGEEMGLGASSAGTWARAGMTKWPRRRGPSAAMDGEETELGPGPGRGHGRWAVGGARRAGAEGLRRPMANFHAEPSLGKR